MNLYDHFRAGFPADLSRPLMEVPGGRTYTYCDLETESGRLAGSLSSLGVGKGDRVAVQVEKSPQAVFLYLACLRAGAVYLPLNTAYTRSELAYFLNDAEPALVVCRPQDEAAFHDLARETGVGNVRTLGADGGGSLSDGAASHAADFASVPVQDDDLAAILYTSGTTGRSKGAMLTVGNLASNAETLKQEWRFTGDDVLLHALPIFHVHGLFVAMNTVLSSGARMLFLAKFDPAQVVDLLPRATVMMGVPTFYTRLLGHDGVGKGACRNIRLFVSGSAPLLAETFDQFEKRTGHRILERYGMTETGMNTSNPYEGERRPGTVGFPLPGVSLRVVDADSGAPLPQGEVGIIEVKGPNVFKGYWRMPEKTAEEFRPDGFFITGDIGKVDTDGYVHIVGRAKDMIISGGYNVYPKEIEGLIDALDGVAESAVIGLPHPDFGEAVAAAVVPSKGAVVQEADVVAAVKQDLANYKVPKKIFVIDELPRNTMGKVQKNVLRERWKDLFR